LQKTTNLVVVDLDNPREEFELTAFDTEDSLITCPQWLSKNLAVKN
jgi:hypothetical protein